MHPPTPTSATAELLPNPDELDEDDFLRLVFPIDEVVVVAAGDADGIFVRTGRAQIRPALRITLCSGASSVRRLVVT